MPRSRFLPLVTLALIAAGLTGCQPGALDPDASSAPSTSAEPDPSGTQEPSGEPSGEPSEEPSGEPTAPPTTNPIGGDLDVPCATLFTIDQLYELNPNFAPTNAPAVAVPGAVDAVAAAGGVTCAYQHVTNTDALFVAAAPAAEATAAAPFSEEGDMAVATRITDEWSVAVASPLFLGDEQGANRVIDQVLGNLAGL